LVGEGTVPLHPPPHHVDYSIPTGTHIYCGVKNIALSVDENILATIRRHAAERNTTVNALVREYLADLAAHEDRAKRTRARLQQLSAPSQGQLDKKTWTREHLREV